IAKELTELMSGEISVESEPGKGSTFYINFRQGFVDDDFIDDETIESLKNFRYKNRIVMSNKLVRMDLSRARVLVVDDSPTNLDVAKGFLGKYKMQVDCVSSGQEALDKIRKGEVTYHAIFMDHMMPGMDGIETTELIRKHGNNYAKNIPIIALTANAVVGNEQMFLDNGFSAYVTKPINALRLDAVVRKWIHP
ncbi:MAG: response regulator, partial [Oscillospiraceae bacterium]|nr:response regulator [Oscillospiraceae bacterium]